jgi:hypothetical protein
MTWTMTFRSDVDAFLFFVGLGLVLNGWPITGVLVLVCAFTVD